MKTVSIISSDSDTLCMHSDMFNMIKSLITYWRVVRREKIKHCSRGINAQYFIEITVASIDSNIISYNFRIESWANIYEMRIPQFYLAYIIYKIHLIFITFHQD